MLNNTHSHSLNSITGYVVFRTVENGRILAERKPVATFLRDSDYGAALSIAQEYRGDGNYAVVQPVYACGCMD